MWGGGYHLTSETVFIPHLSPREFNYLKLFFKPWYFTDTLTITVLTVSSCGVTRTRTSVRKICKMGGGGEGGGALQTVKV